MREGLPVTPSFRLDGRRALVTGGGRGIGVGAGAALAQLGAHVTLAARTAGEVEQVAAAIRKDGGSADAMVLDVTDSVQVNAAIERADPFDILVNNAGANRPGPFLQVVPDDFDAVMAINVRAAFFVAQAVARRLVNAGRSGSIIHISSQMGKVGAANRSVYCASKWAMEGFSKAMAIELAQYSIRSNTICPTFIATSMTRPFLDDPEFRVSVLSKIKTGRLGELTDLMGAIVFLASDASLMMTGSSLVIDGGWTAE
jgi:NAD(P)-dependent dehydrogenase (short-subunit alcohol dehydrogenase family)